MVVKKYIIPIVLILVIIGFVFFNIPSITTIENVAKLTELKLPKNARIVKSDLISAGINPSYLLLIDVKNVNTDNFCETNSFGTDFKAHKIPQDIVDFLSNRKIEQNFLCIRQAIDEQSFWFAVLLKDSLVLYYVDL